MNVLALVLYVMFGVAAFGWRTWVQWRQTGDTGLRLDARRGTVQWWAKLGLIAALAAGVIAPVAGLAGLDPLDAAENVAVRTVGTVLAVLGILATLWTQRAMGASWRIGVDPAERTGLVTHGVFGVVRNPVFSAMVVTGAGLALMVANVIAIVGFVALVVALEVQVRCVEEPYLCAIHGADYRRYAARTGRFVPRFGRLTGF